MIAFDKYGLLMFFILNLFFSNECFAAETEARVLYSFENEGKTMEVISFFGNEGGFFAVVRERDYGKKNFSYRLLVSKPEVTWFEFGDQFDNELLAVGSIRMVDKGNVEIPVSYQKKLIIYNYDLLNRKLTTVISLNVDMDVNYLDCKIDACYLAGVQNGKYTLSKVERYSDRSCVVSKIDLNSYKIKGFRGVFYGDNLYVIIDANIMNNAESGILMYESDVIKKYVRVEEIPRSARVRIVGENNRVVYVSINTINRFVRGRTQEVFFTDFHSIKSQSAFPGNYLNSSLFTACSNKKIGAINVQEQGDGHVLTQSMLGEKGASMVGFTGGNQRLYYDIQSSSGQNGIYVMVIYHEIRSYKAIPILSVLHIGFDQVNMCGKLQGKNNANA